MTVESTNTPARIVALIGMLFVARDTIETSAPDKPFDEFHLKIMHATAAAVRELDGYIDIFDTLGVTMLEQELAKTTPFWMSCTTLLNVITNDYGLDVIKQVVQQVKKEGTFTSAAVEQAIDDVIIESDKHWQHRRDNPGHWDVTFMYPPMGNTELVKVGLARKLPALAVGTSDRAILAQLVLDHHDGLHRCLVVEEDIRRRKLDERTKAYIEANMAGLLPAGMELTEQGLVEKPAGG